MVSDDSVAICLADAGKEEQGQQAKAESPAAVRQQLEAQQQRQQKQRRRQADSTDWFASTLTRRFGLAGGLAWLGFLSFGVISEQVLGVSNAASAVMHTHAFFSAMRWHLDITEAQLLIVALLRGAAACGCLQIKTRLEVAADEKGTKVNE